MVCFFVSKRGDSIWKTVMFQQIELVVYKYKHFPPVDHLISGENMGLECKKASAYNADKWIGHSVPAHYEILCHHYMAVTGAAKIFQTK